MTLAVPDMSIDPILCPILTPLYRSSTSNILVIIPWARPLKGATAAAITNVDIKARLIKCRFIAVISIPPPINTPIILTITTIFLPYLSAQKPAMGILNPKINTINIENHDIIFAVSGITIGKYCFIKITET